MLSGFLNVPFQLFDELPLGNILSELIKKDFFQPVSSFHDLDRAQELSRAVASGARDPNVNLNQYELILKEFVYFIQDLEKKFPNNSVTFEWYSTLSHRPVLCKVRDWKVQQWHILFQLGALYSNKAHNENIHSDEGIKLACVFFSMSAGCFRLISSQLTPDLSEMDKSTVQALEEIMMAQAQELIWQKAVKNSTMKHTLIAKLSMKVADFYNEAWKHAKISEVIIQEWINHIQVKMLHFKAAAHYRMSINALDSFEYGAQVAHLKYASQLCKDALKHKRYVSSFVLEDLSGLSSAVEDSKKIGEKDNDLVYLKPVPEVSELPNIVGASMVEPKDPNWFFSRGEEFATAFKDLVPFTVIQVSQAFRERQDAYIINTFYEPMNALDRMLHEFLAERCLPASIDTIQKPESIPDSIVNHSQEIMSIGGIKIIERSMDEISEMAVNCKQLVEDCELRLRMEKEEDAMLREQEGNAWTRAPSEVTNEKHTTTVEKMHEYLEQGHSSDVYLGKCYEAIKQKLVVYCGGHDTLAKYIPRCNSVTVDQKTAKLASQLRDLLYETQQLEIQRDRLRSSIEIKSRNHNVLPVVLKSFKHNPMDYCDASGQVDARKFEPVFEKHIKFFSPDLKHIEQSKEKQIKLEKQIIETNEEFTKAKENSYNTSQDARLQILQGLEEAYTEYLKIVQNLNQASKFYSSFLQKGNVALAELDKYLYSRRDEARELSISINNQRDLEGIEQSMIQGSTRIAAPTSHRATTWDPSKGIKFA